MQENIVTKETLKHALQGAGGGGGLYCHTLSYAGEDSQYRIISTRNSQYENVADIIENGFNAGNILQIYYHRGMGIYPWQSGTFACDTGGNIRFYPFSNYNSASITATSIPDGFTDSVTEI